MPIIDQRNLTVCQLSTGNRNRPANKTRRHAMVGPGRAIVLAKAPLKLHSTAAKATYNRPLASETGVWNIRPRMGRAQRSVNDVSALVRENRNTRHVALLRYAGLRS